MTDHATLFDEVLKTANAVGLVVVSGVASWIAWRQQKIADAQRRRVEFDILFEFYRHFFDLCRRSPEDPDFPLEQTQALIQKSHLLLEDNLRQYLDEVFTQSLQFRMSWQSIKATSDRGQPVNEDLLRSNRANQDWLVKQISDMRTQFAHYVQPLRPIEGTAWARSKRGHKNT